MFQLLEDRGIELDECAHEKSPIPLVSDDCHENSKNKGAGVGQRN